MKAKIKDEKGISPSQQSLVFDGKLLQNNRKLDDYKVQKKSTIYLILKLRGGGKFFQKEINIKFSNISIFFYLIDFISF